MSSSSSFFIRKRKGGASSSIPQTLSSRITTKSPNKHANPKNPRYQQQRATKWKRGAKSAARAPEAKRSKNEEEDDEITSESEEEVMGGEEDELSGNESHSSETEQEARVRIAKEQISALRSKLLERNVEVSDHDVAGLIKENELVEEGKVVRKVVTQEFTDKLLVVTKLLYGKVVKTPLTCVRSTNSHAYASTKSGVVVCVSMRTRSRSTVTLKPGPVTSLAVSDTTVAASTSSAIHLLTPITLAQTHKFTTAVNTVHLAISSTTLFSTHKDRTVKLWNLTENAYVESLFGHQDVPPCVDALHENRIVTAGGFDRTLRVWKIDEESQLVFNWDEDIIDVVAVVNPGFFVAGSCSGSIALFSFGRKKPLHVVQLAHGVSPGGSVGRWVTCLAGVGDLVASGSDDGVVKVWRIAARKLHFVRDVHAGVGVVVGISVWGREGEDVTFVVGLGTENTRGRFGGRYSNCSTVLCIN